MTRRTLRKKQERGFALLVVLILVIFMTVSATLALNRATGGLRSASSARASEMVTAAMTHGLNQAIHRLETMDPAEFANIDQYNIFSEDPSAPRTNFVDGWTGSPDDPMRYPPDGDWADTLEVYVGLRTGQQTLAPAGEDATTSQGFVLEVLLRVRGRPDSEQNQAEQRAVVGIQMPHTVSHAN